MRGLKLKSALAADFDKSRTPQGVRGLKFDGAAKIVSPAGSRTPQGVRGLKSISFLAVRPLYCRTPQGVRGLKCDRVGVHVCQSVAPRKGCVD